MSNRIYKITELSKETAAERQVDPDKLERMRTAAKGQAPRYLLISPINRGSQDLPLLRLGQGDAFHATRVPGCILPTPDQSPFLFGGPAAYNKHFPDKRGVILTFENDEPEDIVRVSMDNVSAHPDLSGLPVIGLRVDYEAGRVRLVVHGKGRDYEAENYVLSRVTKPPLLDNRTLVLICSDSRVHPPLTPRGVPLAIQTLGGHVPAYNPSIEECQFLERFFEDWLVSTTEDLDIIVIAHGNFVGEGPSCGAGQASLNPENIAGKYLQPVIQQIMLDAQEFEQQPARTAEDRVIALAQATVRNLTTYPAIKKFLEGLDDQSRLIEVLLMDTVSNELSPSTGWS
jgi:carbonic anhydrase